MAMRLSSGPLDIAQQCDQASAWHEWETRAYLWGIEAFKQECREWEDMMAKGACKGGGKAMPKGMPKKMGPMMPMKGEPAKKGKK